MKKAVFFTMVALIVGSLPLFARGQQAKIISFPDPVYSDPIQYASQHFNDGADQAAEQADNQYNNSKRNKNDPKGIAIASGIFTNFNSDYNNYYIYFATMPYTNEELTQIIQELIIGIYAYNSEPWLSLENANDSYLEVLLRPPYKDTLVSQTLISLDYRMKGYLNGGYFPEVSTQNWQFAWGRARTLTEKNRVLQQYGYVDLHKMPGYRSSWDYFTDSDVNEETMRNISSVSLQIYGILDKTKSYENLYFGSAESWIDYHINWSESTSEDEFSRKYPSQYKEVKRCLDGVHSDVGNLLDADQEMVIEIQKLNIITYLVNFLRTLKEYNLIPILAEKSKMIVAKSPGFLPKVLSQQPTDNGVYSFSIGGGIELNVSPSIENGLWKKISNFHSSSINAMNEIPINTVKKIPLNNDELNILRIAVKKTRANADYSWLLTME
jgi:hypothetical protein